MIESNSLDHFEIVYNGLSGAYEFDTEDCHYIVTFIYYTDVMGLSYPIYSFGIERYPEDKRYHRKDHKVRNTILTILSLFFKNNENALVAVFDSSDGRQLVRHRLFSQWYEEFGRKDYCMLSDCFQIEHETDYAMALFHRDHPGKDELTKAFNDLLKINFYN
ncbi:DUF6169 family protein [uncultured Prevotella sp.]|uniref:DUF6169 family protein n=1 Tax=uncultured Prevotella sp. TaxID=159272 RepID=UPI00259BC0CA|nr:DUF6169 family protein [uncultured Prevotella sp.]